MLRAAINVHWSQKVTNKKLYNGLPKITKTIRYHRLKFSGHIWRHGEETTSNVIFCIPTNRKNNRGRPQKTDGLQREEPKSLMANSEDWKSFINSNVLRRFNQ